MKEKKVERLYDAITDVDDWFLEEMWEKPQRKNIRRIRWTAAAACLCVLLAALAGIGWGRSHIGSGRLADMGGKGMLPDGDPQGYLTGPGTEEKDETEISQQDPAAEKNEEDDRTPVYYSSLPLPEGRMDEEVTASSEGQSADVAEFDEAMLMQDHCCMIIEGTVRELRSKRYDYDMYSDKFEENGILHGIECTVVYEVEVEKTWYGEDVSGETIVIEDMSYFTEPVLALQKGRKYVLPIYEAGDTIGMIHEYAGGDITRESPYSIIYPYGPQIEVTLDGSYIVPQQWKTLTAGDAREIVMDTLEDGDYYKDKMRLVDGETFARQMEILADTIEQSIRE